MRCEDVRTHFADYLNRPTELPAPILEHVAACGACRAEFSELCELWEDMARVPAPEPNSIAMRARFRAGLTPAPQPTSSWLSWWMPRRWTFSYGAVAAGAAIAGVLLTQPAQVIQTASNRDLGVNALKVEPGRVLHAENVGNVIIEDSANGLRVPKKSAETKMVRIEPETLKEVTASAWDKPASSAERQRSMAQTAQQAQQFSENSQDLKGLFDMELDQARSSYERAQGTLGQLQDRRQEAYQFQQNGQFRFDGWSDANHVAYARGSIRLGNTSNDASAFRFSLPAAATLVPADPALPAADTRNAERLSGDVYDRIIDNAFVSVSQEPLATFSTDVDTASYANVRRFLNQNQIPPRNAVRIEELINYFRYNYPQPGTGHPIAASIEAATAPWDTEHRLVRIGLKAKEIQRERKPTNLVFLIDVSGSMNSPDKLPLLKAGLRMLAAQLTENDTVTIVTYAGTTGVALPPTNGENREVITGVIDGLNAEGSTNGASGIQMAYAAATSKFIKGGVNRVILATDGDFNVGITNTDELVRMIEDKAKSGVFLSVLGLGSGNLNDSMMEKLADHGNGQYSYIDSMDEARKVLVDEVNGTLVTVAKDVKVQVEFNPALVSAYRLIGYENRALAAADFANDAKDAGDMGAGHTVTALFEVVPRGASFKTIDGQPLRFQPAAEPATNSIASNEMLNLKIRYKEPEAATSKLIEFPLVDRGQAFAAASADFRFASAVAAFGMILRDSPYKGTATWELVRSIAENSRAGDRTGARDEFIQLVQKAAGMWRR
ncbi:MAG TPA: von Willebrand factor type A domain-containing protein [Terriglobia bacterium]|nr:von Willebrand factor type A domain-containing protein [Terriglobia bacterium]